MKERKLLCYAVARRPLKWSPRHNLLRSRCRKSHTNSIV
jgi:hypothetical protein